MEEITLSEKKTLLSSYIFRVVGFDSINPRVDGPGEYRMTLKITCNKMPNKTLEQVLNDAIGVRVSLLNMGVTNPRVDTFKEEVNGWYRLSCKKTAHYFIKPPNKNEAISLCGRLRLSQFSTHDLEDAPENGIYCCHRCEELLARRRGMNIV